MSLSNLSRNILQSFLHTGPTRVDDWRRAADALDVEYIQGTFFRSDRLIAEKGSGRITVDLFSRQALPVTTFTRFEVLYLPTSDFLFSVRHGDARDTFAQLLGAGKDIQVGDATFDTSFVVRSNDEKAVKTLLADERIRRNFPRRPGVSLAATRAPRRNPMSPLRKTATPPGANVLSCWVLGIVRDRAEIAQHIELVNSTLGRLRGIGEASHAVLVSDLD